MFRSSTDIMQALSMCQLCTLQHPACQCKLLGRPQLHDTVLLPLLQVRAQNLQELVYKQGSAGITKATVSIVFHNNEPANGPSGYEDKEYITVTRQVCRPELMVVANETHSWGCCCLR